MNEQEFKNLKAMVLVKGEIPESYYCEECGSVKVTLDQSFELEKIFYDLSPTPPSRPIFVEVCGCGEEEEVMGEECPKLEPEEVEDILQYLCGYPTREDDKKMREDEDYEAVFYEEQDKRLGPDPEVWNYHNGQPFVTEDINLQFIGSMTDPVALWRAQMLRSWYGTVRGTKVLIVLGTDEGLNIPSCVLTGRTVKDLYQQIQTDEMKMVYAILPKDLVCYEEGK